MTVRVRVRVRVGQPWLSLSLVWRLTTLTVLSLALSAHAAVIYRWVDKQGKTHFGDAVPSQYQDVAKPVENRVTTPSQEAQAQAQAQATQRAAQLKDKARGAASAPNPPSPAAASAPTAQKRPPNAPSEATDCETWRRLYRESLDCFGPFRTARGATLAQAFDHCTPVTEPPPRCGRSVQ